MVLTTLLSYGAVTFHRDPCEKLLRDGKLATSSIHLGTVDLRCRHAAPSWRASVARSPLGCLCCSLCACKAPRQLIHTRLWACS